MKAWPWLHTTNQRHKKLSYTLLNQAETTLKYGNKLTDEVEASITKEDDIIMNKLSYEIDNENYSELVSSKNSRKLKKGLCIGLTVIVIIALCGTTYFYLNKKDESHADTIIRKPSVPFNAFLENKLYPRRANASWISNTELLFKDKNGNVEKFNVETNQTTHLAGIDIPSVAASSTQELSPDSRYLLLGRDYQKIFRHSAVARYDILDLETKKVTEVSPHYLLLAEWGPVGNKLIFVYDNNVFFKPNVSSEPIQITDDGQEFIYNGVCDWVYEEEVFSTKKALWFSPDGTKLAFIRLDDTPVRRIQIPVYGIPGAFEHQYPGDIVIPYPKTGSPNPLVKLFSVDLKELVEDQKLIKYEVVAPKALREQPHIVSVVSWLNNETLLSTWMNRVQNQAYIQTCIDEDCKDLFNLTSTTGWINFFKAPISNFDGSQFVFLNSQKQSNNDSYRHLTLVSSETGKQTALTEGNYVVLSILKWDVKNNYIFYLANQPNASYVKHIYAIQGNATVNGERKKFCLTCNIKQDNVNQTFFSAKLSPNSEKLLLSNDGPSLPRTDIVSMKLTDDSVELKHNYVWEDNKKLNSLITNASAPVIHYYQIPLKSGFEAIVKLTIPPNADLSGKTKYPMLIDVYAGPGSYAGSDSWQYTFGTYLSTNRSYIYAQINGRGSGNRGDKLLHSIYRNMGTVEIEDQIETAKKLPELFSYIDPDHIGIWGWSYGGYVSAMALAKDKAHVFKCAASVAPVTDWTYYDSIYTERFMGLPFAQDNLAGYDRSRLSTLPHLFKNKTFLLIHGSLDDNVHYQQSMALARSLEITDIPFEQITYPDEDHGLWGVRKHLFHALDKFFKTCLSNKN